MLLSCLSVFLHQFLQLNHHHVHNQFGNQELKKKKQNNCACKQVNRKAHFATTSLSIDLTHIDLLFY
jgi:hypothetical protein